MEKKKKTFRMGAQSTKALGSLDHNLASKAEGPVAVLHLQSSAEPHVPFRKALSGRERHGRHGREL